MFALLRMHLWFQTMQNQICLKSSVIFVERSERPKKLSTRSGRKDTISKNTPQPVNQPFTSRNANRPVPSRQFVFLEDAVSFVHDLARAMHFPITMNRDTKPTAPGTKPHRCGRDRAGSVLDRTCHATGRTNSPIGGINPMTVPAYQVIGRTYAVIDRINTLIDAINPLIDSTYRAIERTNNPIDETNPSIEPTYQPNIRIAWAFRPSVN
jgi:hypothetical protein